MPREKTAIKVKKKKWFEIVAPKLFDERVIGETTVTEASRLIGKPVLLNLMALTNDPRKQNISIKFNVESVKDDKAFTRVTGYYLSSSSFRRMMRRATKRIDDSIIAETSDNVRVRIKPFLLTRKYVTGSISSNVRKLTRSFISKQVKKNTYEELVDAVVTNKFQRSLSAHLKRIYPLRVCEIKTLYIEKERKRKVEKKPKAEEKVQEIKSEPKKEEPKTEVKEEKKKKEEVKGEKAIGKEAIDKKAIIKDS